MDLAEELLHEVFDHSDPDEIDEKAQKPLEGSFSFSNDEITLKTHEDRSSSGVTESARKTDKNSTEKARLAGARRLPGAYSLLKSEFVVNILNVRFFGRKIRGLPGVRKLMRTARTRRCRFRGILRITLNIN